MTDKVLHVFQGQWATLDRSCKNIDAIKTMAVQSCIAVSIVSGDKVTLLHLDNPNPVSALIEEAIRDHGGADKVEKVQLVGGVFGYSYLDSNSKQLYKNIVGVFKKHGIKYDHADYNIQLPEELFATLLAIAHYFELSGLNGFLAFSVIAFVLHQLNSALTIDKMMHSYDVTLNLESGDLVVVDELGLPNVTRYEAYLSNFESCLNYKEFESRSKAIIKARGKATSFPILYKSKQFPDSLLDKPLGRYNKIVLAENSKFGVNDGVLSLPSDDEKFYVFQGDSKVLKKKVTGKIHSIVCPGISGSLCVVIESSGSYGVIHIDSNMDAKKELRSMIRSLGNTNQIAKITIVGDEAYTDEIEYLKSLSRELEIRSDMVSYPSVMSPAVYGVLWYMGLVGPESWEAALPVSMVLWLSHRMFFKYFPTTYEVSVDLAAEEVTVVNTNEIEYLKSLSRELEIRSDMVSYSSVMSPAVYGVLWYMGVVGPESWEAALPVPIVLWLSQYMFFKYSPTTYEVSVDLAAEEVAVVNTKAGKELEVDDCYNRKDLEEFRKSRKLELPKGKTKLFEHSREHREDRQKLAEMVRRRGQRWGG